MTAFIGKLWAEQRPMMLAGIASAALFLILAIISAFDNTQILGINRWIKPMKFASSVVFYALALAAYLYFLKGHDMASKVICWSVIFLMAAELALIIMQAARGTTSHFNIKTPFDGAVFGAMGIMIAANTLIIAYLAFLYFISEIDLPIALIWGLRLGLIVFLFGSIEGGYMSSLPGHTVGAKDGGAGLPFVNWSITNGDLRVAHFIGLHALQAIPLAALLFQYLGKKFRFLSPLALTCIFAAVYFASFNFLFIQALQGKPVVNLEKAAIEGRR